LGTLTFSYYLQFRSWEKLQQLLKPAVKLAEENDITLVVET
jgi:hypothetical protein